MSEEPSIRADAVAALSKCGDESVKIQLLPLVHDQLTPDRNQQIKGRALAILWPDHLTAADLFASITPSADNFMGAYARFLSDLPQSLSEADVVVALKWASAYVRTMSRTGQFHIKGLADDILAKAWEYADNPEVMQAIVFYVRLLLRNMHGLFLRAIERTEQAFRTRLRTESQKRRQFLLALLRQPQPLTSIEVISLRPSLLQESDLEWLLSISPRGTNPVAGVDEQSLCGLIEAICNVNNPAHFEAMYSFATQWPLLHQHYQEILDGVPLVSASAERQREYYRLTQRLESTNPPPIDPPPAERISMGLERFENGEISAWWPLTLNLMLSLDNPYYNELSHRITTMPGWAAADEVTRRLILIAAKRYLEEAAPAIEKWIGKNTYMHSDVAAYRALALLKEVDPDTYDGLYAVVWKKWTPVVVAVPKESGSEEAQFHDTIASDAVTNAPEEFAQTVQQLIRLERRRSRTQSNQTTITPFFILRTLDQCWHSPALKEVVYAELKNRNNSPAQCEALLGCLLKASYEPACEFALRLFTPSRIRTANGRSRALAAAAHLLIYNASRSWTTIWRCISKDVSFGCDLFLKIGHEYRHEPEFYLELSESDLASLYVWLEENFPTNADPDRHGGAFWVGPRESVAHLRRKVLSHLVSLGSQASVQALRGIVARLTDRGWLAYELLEAEKTMRIKTWAPLSPSEVIRVTNTSGGFLVRSERDLADLLIDALRRYERELHGEQTPVQFLWDRQANGFFVPVDEDTLSDHVRLFLKRELADKGIVLNREVEIGRVPGSRLGSRTDIKVDAIRKSENGEAFSTITAVIETKGCWNPGLLGAIKTQLVEDYLVRIAAPIGIYLVGWFDKRKWDPDDYRIDRTPEWTIEVAQQRLDAIAATLQQAFIVRAVVLDCHCH